MQDDSDKIAFEYAKKKDSPVLLAAQNDDIIVRRAIQL